VNILRTRCTWDATRAIEFESQLHQIRIALRGLHQALVRLRSAKRTILKKQLRINHDTTKGGENNNADQCEIIRNHRFRRRYSSYTANKLH
jgi:hypothetical protein